jgi:hypothetical protein
VHLPPLDPSPDRPGLLVPGVLVGVIVVVAAALVLVSLGRPEIAAFAPTPPAPAEVGERLVGPVTLTVDARSGERWVYFDFSRGSVVEDPDPLDWDLAFRRFHVMVNGGSGVPGRGGALALDEVALGGIPLDSVREAPAGGYRGSDTRTDSVAAPLARWYSYSWTSHLLTPEPRVYAVRTADGRYALLEIVGYYCPGAEPGCLTLRYRYQGTGERVFDPPMSAEGPP